MNALYRSRDDGFTRFGATAGGEAEGNAFQIVFGAVGGIAVLFDGQEKLGHRAVEAVGEPGAFEFWFRPAFIGVEGDGLLGEAWALADEGAFAAGDVGLVVAAEFYIRIKDD